MSDAGQCTKERVFRIMWSTIGTAFLGFIGGIAGGFLTWIATNFLGTPVVDFRALRDQVQEELIHTGNVGPMTAHRPEYDKAVESLRRLGARMKKTKATAEWPLRWFVSLRGYDLETAGNNLIGLSNALALKDDSRAVHINRIQVALRLPRDYSDDYLQQVAEQRRKPQSR